MAQHWGRRGAHLSENKGVKSECKKFGENSRQMAPVSKICDEYFSPYNEPEISALGTPVLFSQMSASSL